MTDSTPDSLAGVEVLVVEPSLAQARFLSSELQALGIDRVRAAHGLAEALASLRQKPADIVVSALYLPEGTGTDLVFAMRREPALEKVAFVLVSSEVRPQALEPVRQAGVCAILPKPFHREQLKRALFTTLEFLTEAPELVRQVDMQELKVLLVDDSGSARRFIRRVLESLGVQRFVEAPDGKVAAGLLATTQVDLVVTDYNMPEMDGAALVEFIRTQSWQKSVPVLMVTSESDAGRLAAVMASGVSGVCDKPFEASVVQNLLRTMLGTR